jgi:hypothetical protein
MDLTIEKREQNDITYPDGHHDQVETFGYGGCSSQGYKCYPEFRTPKSGDGHWEQDVVDKRAFGGSVCGYITGEARTFESDHTCQTAGSGCTTAGFGGSCPLGTYQNGTGMCCSIGDGTTCDVECFETNYGCPCYGISTGRNNQARDAAPRFAKANYAAKPLPRCYCSSSPILIDVRGDGYRMTDAAR